MGPGRVDISHCAMSSLTKHELLVRRFGAFDLQGGQGHICTPPILELESVQKKYQKRMADKGRGGTPDTKKPAFSGL